MYLSWQRLSATRRDRLLSIALPLGGFVGVNGLVVASAVPSNPGWVLAAVIPAVIGTQLLTIALLRKEQRRARALVEAADFKICPGCRYPLKGLEDQGDCPECGRRYSQGELRKTWTDAYEFPTPSTPAPSASESASD